MTKLLTGSIGETITVIFLNEFSIKLPYRLLSFRAKGKCSVHFSFLQWRVAKDKTDLAILSGLKFLSCKLPSKKPLSISNV